MPAPPNGSAFLRLAGGPIITVFIGRGGEIVKSITSDEVCRQYAPDGACRLRQFLGSPLPPPTLLIPLLLLLLVLLSPAAPRNRVGEGNENPLPPTGKYVLGLGASPIRVKPDAIYGLEILAKCGYGVVVVDECIDPYGVKMGCSICGCSCGCGCNCVCSCGRRAPVTETGDEHEFSREDE